MSIPKVLHFFWFGNGKYTKINEKCIRSWEKMCPDFEIKIWNEDNFNVHMNEFVETAYEKRKWALITDYARFYVLYKQGGVYIETDTEILKPLDDELLDNKVFLASSGKGMTLSILGAVRGADICKDVCEYYENNNFLEKGEIQTVNAVLGSILKQKYSWHPADEVTHLAGNIAIYPPKFFYTDWTYGKLNDKNSYVFHYGEATWADEEFVDRKRILIKCVCIFGHKLGWGIGYLIYYIKYNGILKTIKKCLSKLAGEK